MPRFTDIGSYIGGLPLRDGRGFLAFAIDELAERKVPHAILVAWQAGKFLSTTQKGWLLADLVQAPSAQGDEVWFVGANGRCWVMGPHGERSETLSGPGIDIGGRGPLRRARAIGDHLYVVGGDRQVYRRTAEHGWQSFDEDSRLAPDIDGKIQGFESIDGFGAEEIYAVGLRGEIWWHDGRAWGQAASPTALLLNAVCCAGDGQVYAAGLCGTLLRGRRGDWEVMPLDGFVDDIWDLRWFQGALYVATLRGVYRLVGEALVLQDSGAVSAGRLAGTDQVLWATGAKDVVAFDGQAWSRID